MLRQAYSVPLPRVDRASYEPSIVRVRAHLGEVTFAAVWAEGRAMTLEQAIAYALEASIEQVEQAERSL